MINMIIIGFPAIGKSSVALSSPNRIDLESSNFIKDENWVKEYCNVALDLSKQGNVVFVSSHKEVRDYLSDFQGNYFIGEIFPSETIKDIWLERLKNRYESDKSEKNYRAYSYMDKNYDEVVNDMKTDKISRKVILKEDDNLNDLNISMLKFFRHIEKTMFGLKSPIV